MVNPGQVSRCRASNEICTESGARVYSEVIYDSQAH